MPKTSTVLKSVRREKTTQVKHNQLFTQTEDGTVGWKWYPIDHFFYATYDWTPERGLKKATPLVWVEACSHRWCVISGPKQKNREWFDTLPQALRKAADLIEASAQAQGAPAKTRKATRSGSPRQRK
jgi:hypothetical protein